MEENNVIDFPEGELEGAGVEPIEPEPRILQIGTTKHTIIMAMDNKGAGNANHHYKVFSAKDSQEFLEVCFQDGPIKEAGVNGVHNEDLIAIVIDRLEGFQNGQYGCPENALAMIKLEEALHWLRHRTEQRERRGVEGTHEV